jgi:hypothetical protein
MAFIWRALKTYTEPLLRKGHFRIFGNFVAGVSLSELKTKNLETETPVQLEKALKLYPDVHLSFFVIRKPLVLLLHVTTYIKVLLKASNVTGSLLWH